MLAEFNHRVASCATLDEVGEAFRQEIASHGFVSSACRAFVPTQDGSDFRILFRDWPESRTQLSDGRGYTARNFIISEARRRMTPFTWLDALKVQAFTKGELENWEDVLALGLRNGFIQPVHGPGGYFAVVSMATRERAIDLRPGWRASLQALSLCVHERALMLSDNCAFLDGRPALTQRERECLRWVADGKTDADIGEILSISATTVKFHVDRARRKLGACNRAQATARLVLAGLY